MPSSPRWQSTAAGSSSSRQRSALRTVASSRAGSRRRPATGAACWRPRTATRARYSASGVLAGIFQALGAERIYVEDFEMDHVSTDRGGTLTIVVAGEEEAERAANLLEAQGYGVVLAPVIGE
jgi:hypothetical protein